MTISGTTRALAAAALTLATLASIGPAHAGASRAGDPMHGAPTVGTCSTMTATQAAASSDKSTTVPCGKTHTAQVAGVAQLPAQVQWSTAGYKTLFRVVVDRCRPQVNALLGRNDRARDRSAYDYVWFEPTKAQRSKGARWLSCSVVLREATTLAPLPRTTTPFLPAGTLPDRVARCLTKKPYTTRCAAQHLWRATGTFTVAGTYPGRATLNATAKNDCSARVLANRAYRWTYRDKITWNRGHDHVVVCYSRTQH